MEPFVIVATGTLSSNPQAAAHLAVLPAAAAVHAIDDLGGWGASVRMYTIDGVEWSTVVLTGSDTDAPLGGKIVNAHAFRDVRNALIAFEAVASAIDAVREP